VPRAEIVALASSAAVILAVTEAFRAWLHVTNPTIAALSYLLIILVVAASSTLRVAIVASVVADLCLNYFFMPPVGTWTIADPQNVVALFAFLVVSLVASQLSATARASAREAIARQEELRRLLDLSRDILVSGESPDAIGALAAVIARRFDLDFAAVCLPRETTWTVSSAGRLPVRLADRELTAAFSEAERRVEFDARTRSYAGHHVLTVEGHAVRVVPLRLGTKPIGLLAAAGREVEVGTMDALAGVAAIAIERGQFLHERKEAELTRRSEELKSALLASLGHDLRTPLTAIRVAASNLESPRLGDTDRREQTDVILTEIERLTRLFQNILEMARIDAGGVGAESRWAHPSEIIAAARNQVDQTLREHGVAVAIEQDVPVRLDPRLTATAVAHLLENAAQYAPAGSVIDVGARVTGEGLAIEVRDRGPGIDAQDLSHLFERFYRGAAAKGRGVGTGLGLSIARGLLAAEGGRVWAENCADGGARFTIVVPAASKQPEAEGSVSA
jgi:two-component system sensor histidine kinase KdpD